MDHREPFTVADVLKRPIFLTSRVVAGKRGLSRPVRWVHVLEDTQSASFVNGQELILTTGMGLNGQDALALQFVQQLTESGVSGLCIELVRHFTQVPKSVIQFADTHGFPIIVFEHEVRFIDITQDIHAYLIHRHHHQLVSLEEMSRRFLQLTLRPQGIPQILRLLYEETGCCVWLKDHFDTDLTYPPEVTPATFQKQQEIVQPILALDMQVGELHLAHDGNFAEFHHFILDRAATAIAQELLRRISLEERQLRQVQKWIDELLSRGRAQVPAALSSALHQGNACALAAIAPVSTDTDMLEESIHLQWIRQAFPAFYQEGIHAWIAPQEHGWAMVLADLQGRSLHTFTAGIQKGFDRLFAQMNGRAAWYPNPFRIGISQGFYQLKQAPQAWSQAMLALKVHKRPGMDIFFSQTDSSSHSSYSLICYDDLHTWQLFLQMDPSTLQNYISDQLGPLLDYDRQNGTELIRTLEAFFACGQSKQHTAKALFIHRQTLYYRLEQITNLLGKRWEEPPRRLALDTALAAHRFLEIHQQPYPRSASQKIPGEG
jgi:PucR family transcriptional regulator, purine catabolism regulatory protein